MNQTQHTCGYDLAWIGPCSMPTSEGCRCEKHAAVNCSSCGQPATHECDETMGGVCGYPLCDECEHEIAEDGTNGMSCKHCRKDEQKFTPWYAREANPRPETP